MYQLKRNQVQLITFVLIDATGAEVSGLGGVFTLTISKAGGAFAAGTGAKAEIGNGWYSYQLSAAEVDTIGPLSIVASGVGTIQQNLMYVVVSYVVGAQEFNYTLTDDATLLPIVGATIYITTDVAGLAIIWSGTTDAMGVARDVNNELPMLYPGTYYVWRIMYGYTFVDPDVEVIP